MKFERPSVDQLRNFFSGNVSPKEFVEISAYLDACPETLGELSQLDHSDSLLANLRQYGAAYKNEAAFWEGLNKARSIIIESSSASIPVRVDRFKILERISRAGTSAVYHAVDDKTQEAVALKVLPGQRLHDPLAVNRFRQEMSLVGKFNHPNLVRLIDSGEAEGVLFVVMELLAGCDFSQLVERTGPIPIRAACTLVRETALALQYGFQNSMVHRDVKPSNIFLTESGEVKLLDLGLVRFLTDEENSFTYSGQLLGTVDYMAPEQAFDTHNADIRSDIYSLGCTFYKLLTGHPPFSGPDYRHLLKKALAHSSQSMPSIRSLRSDVPRKLVSIIERMCAKQPEKRYQTPAELADALKLFADEHSLLALATQAKQATRASFKVSTGERLSLRSQTSRSKTWQSVKTLRRKKALLLCGVGAIATIAAISAYISSRSANAVRASKQPTSAASQNMSVVQKSNGKGDSYKKQLETVPVVSEVAQVLQESPYSGIWCVDVSPDGKHVRTGSNDGVIRIWNTKDHDQVSSLRKNAEADQPVHDFAFSSDGSRCVAVGYPPYVVLWDVNGQKIIKDLPNHSDRVWAVALSEDGSTVASAGWDETIRITSLIGNGTTKTIAPNMGKILDICFMAADRKSVIVAGRSRVALINTDTEQHRWTFKGYPGYVNAATVSLKGDLVAIGGRDNTIRLLDSQDGTQLRELHGHTDWVNAVALSDDGRWVLSGGVDRSVRLWDAETGQQVVHFEGHDAPVNAVAFMETEPLAISGGDDRTIRFWQIPK